MRKTVAFIGHRVVFNKEEVKKRLRSVVEEKIFDGFDHFIMGTHGDFDQIVLEVCRFERKLFENIEIEVVLTYYRAYAKNAKAIEEPKGEKTVLFDIEGVFFKKRIAESNRQMIDQSDVLICYVDKNKKKSGAKQAMNYAIKKGKTTINIFSNQDDPTFGMTKEERLLFYKSKMNEIKKLATK